LIGELAVDVNGVGQQLQSVSGAAGVCGVAGLGEGRDSQLATGGQQAPALAALQSYRPAVVVAHGISGMCKATPAAADSAQAMCIGNADVQSCFAQEGPAAAVGPDFVEWDTWYAGLASLVE
jgi:hypothetical protein